VCLNIDNDQDAEQLLKALFQKYPNSKFVKSSWVKLAAIEYLRNNYSEAMELYYFIAQTYSGIPEAPKAIKNAGIVVKI
jgi:TolA-binding protein